MIRQWLNTLFEHHFTSGSVELTARFVFVVACMCMTAMIWHLAPLPLREKKAAMAAGFIHFLLATCIELTVLNQGIYRYVIDQQMLWGIPFDIHLGWAALWGAGLCMGWRSVHGVAKISLIAASVAATLAMDFAALASGRVFVPLTPLWWAWDAGALTLLACGTLGFYRLVLDHRALYFRATIYALGYAFVFYVLLPGMILKLSGANQDMTVILQPWSLIALAIFSVPGIIAAVQFAINGDGSALPLDPTRRLVTNGIYAHVRNPMQISGLAAGIIWAASAHTWFLWIYAFDLIVLLQLTKFIEDRELLERFGADFENYRATVPLWLPRLSFKSSVAAK